MIKYKAKDKITYKEMCFFLSKMLNKNAERTKKIFNYNVRTPEKEKISLKNSQYITARNEKGEMVGFVKFISDEAYDFYLSEIMVLPKYRKRNIGKKLIQHFIEYCQKKDAHWCFLFSAEEAYKFYRKYGFNKVKDYIPVYLKKVY